jgi:hypothetical protein
MLWDALDEKVKDRSDRLMERTGYKGPPGSFQVLTTVSRSEYALAFTYDMYDRSGEGLDERIDGGETDGWVEDFESEAEVESQNYEMVVGNGNYEEGDSEEYEDGDEDNEERDGTDEEEDIASYGFQITLVPPGGEQITSISPLPYSN